jgi:tetratricopeptide (TPR) repeat protein
MPVVVLLYIFAGLAIDYAVASRSRAFRAVAAIAFVAAFASAVPIMRPWEYFNEFVGTRNAYKYFSDEGVDLGQRTKELASYTRDVLAPTGDVPDIEYWSWSEELKARDINYLGRDEEKDMPIWSSPARTSGIFTGATFLVAPFFPTPELLAAAPTVRFGNLFFYREKFDVPGSAANSLYYYGIHKLYAEKPDEAAAEKAWRRAVELCPTAFFIHIELGNLMLKRGDRASALDAYKKALDGAPDVRNVRQPIEEQIQLLSSSPAGAVAPLRNPNLE